MRVAGPHVPSAPPRGRGSTQRGGRVHARSVGSPAWAGIDHLRAGEDGGAHRLPRVGGDRPRKRPARVRFLTAPPRGRGSTPHWIDSSRSSIGSPAWAGIDPGRWPAPRSGRRLPRVGGDRPRVRTDHWVYGLAPPRGRGSTSPRVDHVGVDRGSPAWAGIDPRRALALRRSSRLPRVGGDRPGSPTRAMLASAAPPRGRGSTPLQRGAPGARRGSPAWAGIDPGSTMGLLRSPRLPRVGGDRPFCRSERGRVVRAPPRGRGSTLRAGRRHVEVAGSPAWAGIDPAGRSRRRRGRRLPRVGGDRPEGVDAAALQAEAPPRGRGSTLCSAKVSGRR